MTSQPNQHTPSFRHRRRPTRRALVRSILGAALPLLLLGFAVALAASGGDGGSSEPTMSIRATGPVTIGNSKDGKAILTATGKRPGQSQEGTVTITNGADPASYVLSESAVTDTKGLNGGLLSPRLTLKIEDITGAAVTVYNSTFAGMPNQSLGTFAAGEQRSYRFTATFLNGGQPPSDTTGDNLYQGSSSSVGFTWTATTPDTTGGGGGGGGGGTTTTTTTPPPTTTTTQDAPTQTGGGGGGTFGGSGGGVTIPKLGLGGATTQNTTDFVTFFATCNQACGLTIGGSISVPGTSRVYRLTRVTKQLRAGVKTKVTIRFPAKVRTAVRKAISKRKIVTASLQLTTKNAAGAASTSSRRIRIKHR